MHVTATTAGNQLNLRMEGRFDFEARREFRDAVKAAIANDGVAVIVLQLHAVSYIDSSALGMLLLSQEEAKAAGKSITLAGASGMVKKVLEIANFNKLFAFS